MIRRWAMVVLLLAGLVTVPVAPANAAAVLPAGFSDDPVVAVASPTALAFTPDGRMLVTTQPGTLRIVRDGALLTTPALDLTARTCSNSERGLLGVAVDPLFATNRFVYLYDTHDLLGTCMNRVSRWVLGDDDLASNEVVLLDRIQSTAGNHNGGDLNFGKDGYLYVSVGDGGCDYATPTNCGGANDATRDHNVMIGKVLRITRDPGVLPPDNPFLGPDSGPCALTGSTTPGNWCRETFAWGFRNPFRMAFDPNAPTTRFHINDVGQSTWEEIDLGAAGADYGWNVREGHCANGSTTNCGPPPAGMTNPIFDYGHGDGCYSITGGAFVPNGVWPAPFDGRYLFADYGCGKIFRLDPNGSGGFTRTDFVTGLGANSAVHLRFGPWNATQALYYTSYAAGGQVRRISYAAAPVISGSTWYANGTATSSGGAGATVRAYAVGAFVNVAYQLVLATADCRRVVAVLNPNTRFANSSGFISTTVGTVPAGLGAGPYSVCFRSTNAAATPTATGVVAFTLS